MAYYNISKIRQVSENAGIRALFHPPKTAFYWREGIPSTPTKEQITIELQTLISTGKTGNPAIKPSDFEAYAIGRPIAIAEAATIWRYLGEHDKPMQIHCLAVVTRRIVKGEISPICSSGEEREHRNFIDALSLRYKHDEILGGILSQEQKARIKNDGRLTNLLLRKITDEKLVDSFIERSNLGVNDNGTRYDLKTIDNMERIWKGISDPTQKERWLSHVKVLLAKPINQGGITFSDTDRISRQFDNALKLPKSS
ncbi:hypothetical protein A2310_06400 [candidate division WOR-1 bacterium RIFOXYB2_FULL_37_13]|uniref:Uncharacterized protein n=1 Tax=candidate division WOR-1 bacterium RIFOXYB2_FULL_37_13 TaxID=1802579 RepID=A0A1F4SEX3_UNCSA|nr:MAG: hypothetical protein A2310_06400 [candidate division WOR-1 bacterium RIFOXYB2_FULL_37_13]